MGSLGSGVGRRVGRSVARQEVGGTVGRQTGRQAGRGGRREGMQRIYTTRRHTHANVRTNNFSFAAMAAMDPFRTSTTCSCTPA